jgi:tetratricopeptide (TPR) repeat protein
MTSQTEMLGSVETALANTARLLESDPASAVEQANEILKVVPNHPVATLQLGLALGRMGRGEDAVVALRRAVQLKPDMPDAWRALGDHLTAMGDAEGADAAYARHVKTSTRDPRLMQAATALFDNRIPEAEALLRKHLMQHPTDVAAIRMLAEVAARIGRFGDAEKLLVRALELAPSFAPARHNYAVVLHRQNKPTEALAEVERLLEADPRNPGYRNLKAAILARIGEYERSIGVYRGVLAEYPNQAKVWMSFGHALKTAGEQDESVAAYRKAIALTPSLGEAWWSLANLKTFRFALEEIAAMRAQLARTDLTVDDRFHFHFAIGKALEDGRVYAESFEHYAEGNRLRRSVIRYDAEETSEHVRRSKALFTAEFFAARAGYGSAARDPIFIVGLPRSGSTLLEQILASHPHVEGTAELPDIVAIARSLSGKTHRGEPSRYLEALAGLDADTCRQLGELYLERTRIQRKTAAPVFIDKMPNNFAHVGLIHLILPNARIVDARRHPLGCCLSVFKQHFARGQNFSYSLEEVGRYYRDYVDLMAHFDAVLPGRVHRVCYEALIEAPEQEVRRLLAYCGLPFDERCLRFYENERAVRTPSAEQVRQPLYREGVEQWRKYDAWLGPLKDVLGPVVHEYEEGLNAGSSR